MDWDASGGRALAHHTNPKSWEGEHLGTPGLEKHGWQAHKGQVGNRKPAGVKQRQCQLRGSQAVHNHLLTFSSQPAPSVPLQLWEVGHMR